MMGTKICLALLTLILGLTLATPAYAAAWTGDCVKYMPMTGLPNGDTETPVATLRGITCLVKNFLNPFPALIVLAALCMVIFAGYKIVSAGADPKAMASGMQTLTYAVIGIVLLSGVWLIFVTIKQITGVDVTQFGLPN